MVFNLKGELSLALDVLFEVVLAGVPHVDVGHHTGPLLHSQLSTSIFIHIFLNPNANVRLI